MRARRRVRAVAESGAQPVAILFGSERAGLTNEELRYAHALLRIPANPAYAVAQHRDGGADRRLRDPACAAGDSRGQAPARRAPRRRAAGHARGAGSPVRSTWPTVLEEIDFRDRTQSGTHLMKRIRRLLQRAEPDANEVNILRGILTAVQQRRRRAGQDS